MMLNMLGALLAAGALAAMGYFAAQEIVRRASSVQALETFYSAAQDEVAPVPVGSQEHKIRLALGGWAAGRETTVYHAIGSGTGVVLAGVLAAFGLPGWVSLGLGFALAYAGLNSWIGGRWRKTVRSIEAEMPTFLRTLGSMIQVTPNVLDALDETTAALDEKGALRAWMQRFISELRLHGRKGFETMRAEAQAISPTLLLAVVEIGRLWETGGAQFAAAFRQAAENQARILRARNRAQSEIDGARSTLRVILLVLGGAVAFTVKVQPQQFNTAVGRFGLLGLAVLAAAGWMLLQSMMDEVLQ